MSNIRALRAALIIASLPLASYGAELITIYNFGSPVGPTNLIAGPNGVLYGAAGGGTFGRGYVYQLNPPASGGGIWTQTVLYNLTTSDGTSPISISLGPGGAIFGTTASDRSLNKGSIFEVSPPAAGSGGAWTGKTLHFFTGSPDGSFPEGNLAFGPGGTIFGTTQRGGIQGAFAGWGIAFELTPPAEGSGGPYTETIIHSFTGGPDGGLPYSGLTNGANGSLIGTTGAGGTNQFGTVFELDPPSAPGGAWTENVLYSFQVAADGKSPKAGVIQGPNGDLYGTTYYGGTDEAGYRGIGSVYELTPPAAGGSAWTERVLYRFLSGFPNAGYYPAAPVVMGPNGTLYGTTCCGGPAAYGVVFAVSPPASGKGEWNETVLWGFEGGKDGGSPYTGLTLGLDGKLYGTTTAMGVSSQDATVFAVKP